MALRRGKAGSPPLQPTRVIVAISWLINSRFKIFSIIGKLTTHRAHNAPFVPITSLSTTERDTSHFILGRLQMAVRVLVQKAQLNNSHVVITCQSCDVDRCPPFYFSQSDSSVSTSFTSCCPAQMTVLTFATSDASTLYFGNRDI